MHHGYGDYYSTLVPPVYLDCQHRKLGLIRFSQQSKIREYQVVSFAHNRAESSLLGLCHSRYLRNPTTSTSAPQYLRLNPSRLQNARNYTMLTFRTPNGNHPQTMHDRGPHNGICSFFPTNVKARSAHGAQNLQSNQITEIAS